MAKTMLDLLKALDPNTRLYEYYLDGAKENYRVIASQNTAPIYITTIQKNFLHDANLLQQDFDIVQYEGIVFRYRGRTTRHRDFFTIRDGYIRVWELLEQTNFALENVKFGFHSARTYKKQRLLALWKCQN